VPTSSSSASGKATACHTSGSGLREGEQVFHETVLTIHPHEHPVDVLAPLVARAEVGLEELEEPTDGGERGADLVGDARGHAAEEGELIGAPDLLADPPLLRGVPEDEHLRGGGAPPVPALGGDLEEQGLSLGRHHRHLVIVHRLDTRRLVLEEPGERRIAAREREGARVGEDGFAAKAFEGEIEEGLRRRVE
jgi:hypothetical protein